ncbi:hypothetical protein ACRRTK_018701 [Alexandromys fortis]
MHIPPNTHTHTHTHSYSTPTQKPVTVEYICNLSAGGCVKTAKSPELNDQQA